MIKGNQKKVIHIKNTESRIFDEAYFILKEGIALSVPENDIINEANRIIEENLIDEGGSKRICKSLKAKNLAILLSATATTVLAVLLFCLFF